MARSVRSTRDHALTRERRHNVCVQGRTKNSWIQIPQTTRYLDNEALCRGRLSLVRQRAEILDVKCLLPRHPASIVVAQRIQELTSNCITRIEAEAVKVSCLPRKREKRYQTAAEVTFKAFCLVCFLRQCAENNALCAARRRKSSYSGE